MAIDVSRRTRNNRNCLRIVTGAYKTAPIRLIESEARIPPIDIYLNRWMSRLQTRIDRTGMRAVIVDSCSRIATNLRRNRRRTRSAANQRDHPTQMQRKREWSEARFRNGPFNQHFDDFREEYLAIDHMTLIDWQSRVNQEQQRSRIRNPHKELQPADESCRNLCSWNPIRLHSNLKKFQSTLLTQMRTGAIGLNHHLFSRHVPSVNSPGCVCGEFETVSHLFIRCPRFFARRMSLPYEIRTRRDLRHALTDHKKVGTLCSWLLSTGRLREYRLAVKLERELHLQSGHRQNPIRRNTPGRRRPTRYRVHF